MELNLALFAFASTARPTKPLEDRIKQFLDSHTTSESLDGAAFAQLNGSHAKADYLLGERSFVAELKTINGNPKDRVQQRLKDRFAQPGSPVAYGQVGLSQILKGLPDQDEMLKTINDLSARSVRRHLQKSNEQIGVTKARLSLSNAAGLAIIMNDSEPIIDASNIGYTIKSAIEAVDSGYPHIAYIWINIECHRIKMMEGIQGFPQLLVWKSNERAAELQFLFEMLSAWAYFNGSRLYRLDHKSDWNSMRPIFYGGPPILQFY